MNYYFDIAKIKRGGGLFTVRYHRKLKNDRNAFRHFLKLVHTRMQPGYYYLCGWGRERRRRSTP